MSLVTKRLYSGVPDLRIAAGEGRGDGPPP